MSSESRIVHPNIPYATDVSLQAGHSILIRGLVKNDDGKRFNVDLCCGRLVQGDHTDDKALHINPRFDSSKTFGLFGKADSHIVLNSLENNTWMMEHRCENILHVGKPFSLRILVLKDYFKITLNGKLLADFVHRIPIQRIKCLYIAGCAAVEVIEINKSTDQPQPSAPTPNAHEDSQVKEFYKPTTPFVQKIGYGGFLPPREIRITGTPRMNATRFEINLLVGSEYLFHFRVDLPTRDVPQGFVVRNSTKDSDWLNEERDIPFFAFKVGHTFDLALLARNGNCEVNVDGRTLCVFNYRSNLQPKDVKTFSILGDVILQSVHIL